jgi:hypothetical protein
MVLQETFEEAKMNFSEALEIFFEECLKMGTLQDILDSCGWVKRKTGWVPPAYVGEDRIKLPQFATA